MFELISTTPAQKRTIEQLMEKYQTRSVWVQYDPRNSTSTLRCILFASRFVHDYRVDVDGYVKSRTAYDNSDGLSL